MFFEFSRENQSRNNHQNESYVQDNARQTIGRLSEVLTGALGSIKQMSYWFGCSLRSTFRRCRYMRYADAEGVNLAADGKPALRLTANTTAFVWKA